MKILYIHQYFKTPLEPGGTRSYWIAKELIANGHQVTMLTSTDRISSKIERKKIDGIDVIYLKVPYDNNMTLFKRAVSFIRFMVRSALISFKEKDIDLVVSTSTPLTVGLPALLLKKLKRIPYIFEVRDLWPEVPIQMGGLKNKLLIKMAVHFETVIYKNASHIVALSPGMYDGVKMRGIDDVKISMIPNMSKVDEFWPRKRNYELCESMKLSRESFKIIHFGALGLANGAISIIESAKVLVKRKDIEFIFIGGGSTEEVLKKKCRDEKINNVHFFGKYPMKTVSEIVNFCDVSIVSFMDLAILYTNSPNKLFDSLSAGKPIIVNSAGWTKDLVEKYQCGFYVDPNNPDDLANRLIELSSQPELVLKLGKSSRNLAETRFDKSILCKEFLKIVNRIQSRI